MATQTELHPGFPEAREQRELEERQRAIAASLQRREDLVWLLQGRRGRRKVRRQLSDAGFDVGSDVVQTSFDRHHGQMCFNEGLRLEALRLIWPLLRLAALGELPEESLQKLFTETDE